MRKLITSDVFAIARVIKASGMREQLTTYVKELVAQDKPLDEESIGYETLLVMIEALAERKAEAAIYELIASIMETTPDAVKILPPADFFAALKQIGEENDIKSFFGFLSGILTKS